MYRKAHCNIVIITLGLKDLKIIFDVKLLFLLVGIIKYSIHLHTKHLHIFDQCKFGPFIIRCFIHFDGVRGVSR